MSLIGTKQFLERNRFFNGQRLFASDLQAVEEFNREMRWLHNQSLHQPGVGSGFAVSGKKGDREVVIQPGYAIDALGREIVLAQTDIEPVPPIASDGFGGVVYFDLTVAYPDEYALKAAEAREGVCGAPRGAIRLRETPVFCWVKLGPPPDRLPKDANLRDDVQNGLRLRLARAQVLNCQLESGLSIAQRRNARPPAQPYVACGRSVAGDWSLLPAPGTLGIGRQIRTSVDTSAAGFRTTPCYTAQLAGARSVVFKVGDQDAPRMLDGYLAIEVPESGGHLGFEVSVLIPEALFVGDGALDPLKATDFDAQLTAWIKKNNWQVEWIGVEG
jgi:hypothetical protein